MFSEKSTSSRRHFLQVSAAATAASVSMLTPSTSVEASDEDEELLFSSAMSMSKAIRAKRISSEEAVKAHLDRITAINPKINAVVTLTAENADSSAPRARSPGPRTGTVRKAASILPERPRRLLPQPDRLLPDIPR